ncbi:putative triacylglycerol lipase [Dioscorea sansibarensis]
MANYIKTFQVLLLAFLSMVISNIVRARVVPTVFIFGDSLVDVGNNDFLPNCTAKVNFHPYGVDFPNGTSTGRFTNGFNAADCIVQKLGLKMSPPPFLSLNSWTQTLGGVNFASGGSGLLDATGARFIQVLSLGKQRRHFEMVFANLTANLGLNKAEKSISNSIFIVSTGSNDLFEDFQANPVKNETERCAFVKSLVVSYKEHLEALYNLGARKFALLSIPPIGCTPAAKSINSSSDGCNEDLNESARKFYSSMQVMLKELSCNLKGLKYSLGNSFQMVETFFKNPSRFGFKELTDACCGNQTQCLPGSTFCANRAEFLFWDVNHPTEAAYRVAAQTLFGGSRKFVTPINFGQLATIKT